MVECQYASPVLGGWVGAEQAGTDQVCWQAVGDVQRRQQAQTLHRHRTHWTPTADLYGASLSKASVFSVIISMLFPKFLSFLWLSVCCFQSFCHFCDYQYVVSEASVISVIISMLFPKFLSFLWLSVCCFQSFCLFCDYQYVLVSFFHVALCPQKPQHMAY